ncbi:putative leucine-rich repeat domain superfamily [Helianthus annuus]|nr:putative leucine-rich repeat domain superfamily [Helianthus annuus]
MRGLFFIGNGCKKLIELDLYRSIGLTDKGISAVARRCTDLEMINSSYSFVSRVWCIKIVSPQEVQQLGKQGVKVLDRFRYRNPQTAAILRASKSMNLSNGVASVGSLEY